TDAAVFGEQGILISQRLPGFAGFRYFSPGDIVLAIELDPVVRTQKVDVFREVIGRHPAQSLTLQVLRRGKLIKLTLKPDLWPAMVPEAGIQTSTAAAIEEMRQPREEAAEAYWKENF